MSNQTKRIIYLLALECFIAALIVTSLWFTGEYKMYLKKNADQIATDIPFEKKGESDTVSVGRPWQFVTLVLPAGYYSKKNLEIIFRYYTEKYPNKRQALTVDVFAGEDSYERYLKEPPILATIFGNPRQEPLTRYNWNLPHASFLRACDNEFYHYSSNLENPTEREMVLLKGRITAGPELSECR
jgi:hypothetical protein